MPLSPEEAERRHLAREDYWLSVHPADGHLLVVHHRGRKAKYPYLNQDSAFLFPLSIHLTLTTPDWWVDVDFQEDHDTRGQLRDVKVEVFDRRSRVHIWRSDLDAREGLREDRDKRNGEGRVEVAVSEEEMAPHLRTDFVFGDYRSLLRRADAYARWASFGPLPGVPEVRP